MNSPGGAAGEVPQHPDVRCSEQCIAAFRVGADAVDVVEDPLDFAAGEVGGGRQARLAPDDGTAAVTIQCSGDLVGAGVLPDDRVVVGLAGLAVPHDRGLALVSDTQGDEIAGLQIGVVEG